MKPWKAVSLILLALAVAAAGYGLILVRRGFSALDTPSAIEVFAATTARKMAVPSGGRQLRNPIMPTTENIRAGMAKMFAEQQQGLELPSSPILTKHNWAQTLSHV
jgi:hypothetical protein